MSEAHVWVDRTWGGPVPEDAKALRATNAPEADALIRRAYRAPRELA